MWRGDACSAPFPAGMPSSQCSTGCVQQCHTLSTNTHGIQGDSSLSSLHIQSLGFALDISLAASSGPKNRASTSSPPNTHSNGLQTCGAELHTLILPARSALKVQEGGGCEDCPCHLTARATSQPVLLVHGRGSSSAAELCGAAGRSIAFPTGYDSFPGMALTNRQNLLLPSLTGIYRSLQHTLSATHETAVGLPHETPCFTTFPSILAVLSKPALSALLMRTSPSALYPKLLPQVCVIQSFYLKTWKHCQL